VATAQPTAGLQANGTKAYIAYCSSFRPSNPAATLVNSRVTLSVVVVVVFVGDVHTVQRVLR